MIRFAAIAVCLPFFLCSFTGGCSGKSNSWFVTTDDLGTYPSRVVSSSRGGATGAITGSSGGDLDLSLKEATSPGRIKIGDDIEVVGVISNTAPSSVRWFGRGMVGRTIAMAWSFSKAIDLPKIRAREGEKTERLKEATRSRTEQIRLKEATKQLKINSAP